MNGTDFAFGAAVRAMLLSLARTHALPAPWQRLTSDANNVPTTLLTPLPLTTVLNARAAKCAFWKQNGFDAYQWQN